MKKIISLGICALSLCLLFPVPVSASGDDALACPVLSVADPTAAAENVKNSIVTVENDINNDDRISGSGVIIEITDNRLVIATAGHVVGHDMLLYDPTDNITHNYKVYFWDPETDFSYYNADPELGFNAPADLLYCSADHDIAFLTVSTDQLDRTVKQSIRYAPLDRAAYDALVPGDPAFTYALRYTERNVNPNQTKVFLNPLNCPCKITDAWVYDDYSEDNMIAAFYHVLPIPGMSGCGTFDAKGNLVGIAVNGGGNEACSVPLPTVLEEYEKAKEILTEREVKKLWHR